MHTRNMYGKPQIHYQHRNRQYRLKQRDAGAAHAPLVSSMTGTSLLGGADLVAGELMPELPCGFNIWQVK
ncbi:Uncharacterised protein [Arcanobacterium haemolyticum]|nr:Uncharacterised protein [Arcanobacterium haemolyticum]